MILEGKEYPALLDSGAQPSGISLRLVEPDFNLNSVEGKVKLSKSLVLKPFETVLVSGVSESRQHRKLM